MKKIVSATTLFALVLWGCTVLTGFLPAHSKAPDPARSTATGGETLTEDSMKQMLENMGYEPKKLSKGFLLAIKQDSWTLNIQIVLSGDTEKVGLNANLGKVDEPAGVTASQWLDLLISNGNIDPSSFYFDKDQKKLYLHRVMDNRAVTPAILRKQIENFAGNIRQTQSLWKFTK